MRYYQEPLVTVYQGHVLDELAALTPGRCQLCFTSPPYYSLRSYAVEPQVWGGDSSCQHVFGEVISGDPRGGSGTFNGRNGAGDGYARAESRGAFCQACSAWLGSLGLEPRPWCNASLLGEPCTDQCYLGHLLQVCDGIWRVLRDDGLLVWNMGDLYAGGGYSSHANTGGAQRADGGKQKHTTTTVLAPKNLLNLPARFSIAMQAKGWILRSAIPWLKRNSMPESVTDRPSVSHEDVYLFAKGPRVYWDAEAVRESSRGTTSRPATSRNHEGTKSSTTGNHANGGTLGWNRPETGRNRRTADWWYESLDDVIAETEAWVAHAKQVREHGGLLLSPEGEPLGLHVNPQPTKLAHFASFPPRLVRPFILAATSQVGCCERCKTPWRRVVERQAYTDRPGSRPLGARWTQPSLCASTGGPQQGGRSVHTTTLGWEPGCACQDAGVVPCTVLDPFAGTGVTLSVSRSLGRQSVGIDLSAEYCELIKETLHADLPLFPGTHEDEDRAMRVIQEVLDL